MPGDDPLDPETPFAARSRALSFFDASTGDALNDDTPAREAGDALADKLREEAANEATQKNKQRRQFFVWVACLVTACIVAGFVVIGFYIWSQWGELAPSVLISWFSAEIVQTIGLAYIVARYLFPPSRT